MTTRPGRALASAAVLLRGGGAVLLALLAFSALDAPHQRTPGPLLALAGLALVVALAAPARALLAVAALAALLPVSGNLLAGPWVAPTEVFLLLLAAAALLRGGSLPVTPLLRPLAFSTAAVAAGAVAATLAALAPGELPTALGELARSFFAPGEGHAAAPLRAALVHAAGLLAFVLFRREAGVRGERLLGAVVAGLALVGAYAVVEASTGLKLWGAERYEALSRGLRVPATLPDYNATGAATALALFPAIVLAIRSTGARRALWGGASALLLVGLLLSGSRGAWVAALAAALCALAGVAWARRREGGSGVRRLVLGAAVAGAVAIGALALWPGEVGALLRRRAATLVDPDASLRAVRAGRVGFWEAGLRMVETHPLAGVGPGRVPPRFAEFRDPSFPVASENLHLHFLQAFAENGIPGGLLVLWPFVPLGLAAGRLLRDGRSFSSPSAALAPGLLAFALTGFTSHPWLLPELQFLFWGAAALLPAAERGTATPRALVRRFPWILLLAWGAARLVWAPGTERGRFSVADWGARGGTERYFWTGPRALVPVELPEGDAVRVRVRVPRDDLALRPALVSLRLDGGPAVRVSLADRTWHDVVVERGPNRPGRHLEGEPLGLLALEASRSFCPAHEAGADRRVLALQLARPPVSAAGRPAP